MSSHDIHQRFQQSLRNSIAKTRRQITLANRQIEVLNNELADLGRRISGGRYSRSSESWLRRYNIVQSVRCQYRRYVRMKKRKLRKLRKDLA